MSYAEQTLNNLIASVRKSLAEAIEEERNVGSYESALQREFEQGALDALTHYAVLAGFSVNEEQETFCECDQNCLKKQCKMTGLMVKHCTCTECGFRREEVAKVAGQITVTRL